MSRSWDRYPVLDQPPSYLDRYASLILIASGLLVVVGLVVGQHWQDQRLTAELREQCALVAEPAFIDECVEASR